MRQADDGDILDGVVTAQEVLDLYRIEVLAAGDDDVLLAVHQIDETVRILHRHVAGKQPAVAEHLAGRLLVLVVTGHHTGTLDGELADLALTDIAAPLVDNAHLPAVARYADAPTWSMFSTPRCTQPGPMDSDRP